MFDHCHGDLAHCVVLANDGFAQLLEDLFGPKRGRFHGDRIVSVLQQPRNDG
jgi:hypothetical protein